MSVRRPRLSGRACLNEILLEISDGDRSMRAGKVQSPTADLIEEF